MASSFPSRRIGFAAAALVVVAVATVSPAQTLPEFKGLAKSADMPNNGRSLMYALKDGRDVVGGPNLARNRELFAGVAQHYLYKITQEQYYGVAPEGSELKPRNAENSLDVVFEDLRKYFLVAPPANAKMTVDQVEYIKEFGVALDAVLVELLKKRPAPLVRVNIARALAVVAASGAPAHAKTLTDLLKDKTTPPEVLLHTYKATEAFLSAYDPNATGGRNWFRHTVQGPELHDLIKALESHVVDGPPIADKVAISPPPVTKTGEQPPPPSAGRLDNKSLTPEQVEVVRYFRKGAVKALAKCRNDSLSNNAGKVDLRPALTLAKVAVNDASLYPEVSPAEVAEAVIGLCEMPPGQNLRIDEAANAIATGIATLGRLKNVAPDDKSIAWKVYAARISQALNVWKGSTALHVPATPFAKLINTVADLCQKEVVGNLEQGKSTNPDRIVEWTTQNTPKDPKRALFDDAPDKLNPRPLGR